jgi:hypothetical protein
MRKRLQALGSLRNSFTHPPLKTVLTDADEAGFLAALPPLFHENLKVKFPGDQSDYSVGLRVREAITMLS